MTFRPKPRHLIAVRPSLVHGRRRHKAHLLGYRLAALWIAMSAGLVGCASTADVRAQQEEAYAQLEREADILLACLDAVATDRGIEIVRRDPGQRRLTSAWEEESDQVRRRTFLSVLLGPSGLAMRVNITRQSFRVIDGVEQVEELPRTDDVAEEELDIIEAAYALWRSGDRPESTLLD